MTVAFAKRKLPFFGVLWVVFTLCETSNEKPFAERKVSHKTLSENLFSDLILSDVSRLKAVKLFGD